MILIYIMSTYIKLLWFLFSILLKIDIQKEICPKITSWSLVEVLGVL